MVLAARRRGLLEEAARRCEALGGRALAVPTGVTDPAQTRELARSAVSAFGGIDVWVNNAGTSMWGPFEEIPLESQARLIELNLLGAINGSHAALPHFFDRGGRGVIINVPSIFGRVPMPYAASYSASKAGLAGFTEALRFELVRARPALGHRGLRRLPGLRRHANLPELGQLHGPGAAPRPPGRAPRARGR